MRKNNAYVLRLEWASTISFCDIAVQATSPADAIQTAYQECDYDRQDTYDDGGDTYCGAIIRAKSMEHAESIAHSGGLWDLSPQLPIPLKDQDPLDQLAEMRRRVKLLHAALRRARSAMDGARDLFASRGSDHLVVALENDMRKADYVLAQVKP